MNPAVFLLQRQSANRAVGESSLLLLRDFPVAETFRVEMVRAGCARRFILAVVFAGLGAEGHTAQAHAAEILILLGAHTDTAVGRRARVDLEAQPLGHAAAALIHVSLIEAHVLVAHSGPAQTLSALGGVAAGGG